MSSLWVSGVLPVGMSFHDLNLPGELVECRPVSTSLRTTRTSCYVMVKHPLAPPRIQGTIYNNSEEHQTRRWHSLQKDFFPVPERLGGDQVSL